MYNAERGVSLLKYKVVSNKLKNEFGRILWARGRNKY